MTRILRLILWSRKKSGLLVNGAPIANKRGGLNTLLPTLEVRYYEEVVWSLPVEVPEGTEAGEKLIEE